jgi:hypothetical protein
MAQQGYFRTYKECHLDCHGLQAAVLSTGFYYSELAGGIPVYLHVNLSNSFYKNSIKTIVSNRVYKIKGLTLHMVINIDYNFIGKIY